MVKLPTVLPKSSEIPDSGRQWPTSANRPSRFYTPGVGSSILSPPTSLRELRPDLLFEHDLRANAFRVCRKGKPAPPFPDHALKRNAEAQAPLPDYPAAFFSWCRRAPQGGWEVRRICAIAGTRRRPSSRSKCIRRPVSSERETAWQPWRFVPRAFGAQRGEDKAYARTRCNPKGPIVQAVRCKAVYPVDQL